jgi:hypothetical protein
MQTHAREDIRAEGRMLQPSKAAFISLSGVMAAQQSLTNFLDPLFKIASTHTPDIHNSWYHLKYEYFQVREALQLLKPVWVQCIRVFKNQ